jgi:hypothetical protein
MYKNNTMWPILYFLFVLFWFFFWEGTGCILKWSIICDISKKEKESDYIKTIPMHDSETAIYLKRKGPSWSWLYGGWCLSPLTLFVRIPLGRGVLDTTLCDKVCQGQVCGFLRFSSTNKTDRNDIMKYCLNWR